MLASIWSIGCWTARLRDHKDSVTAFYWIFLNSGHRGNCKALALLVSFDSPSFIWVMMRSCIFSLCTSIFCICLDYYLSAEKNGLWLPVCLSLMWFWAQTFPKRKALMHCWQLKMAHVFPAPVKQSEWLQTFIWQEDAKRTLKWHRPLNKVSYWYFAVQFGLFVIYKLCY